MRVLLINTCGVGGSVALADEGGVRAAVEVRERKASEEVMPALRGLLEGVGWGVEDLGAVGVVRGPGSFTGVRTGLSVGKGICEARGIPLVGVSRLEMVAGRVGLVHAVLDAGRGEFYYGLVRDGLTEWQGLVGREEFDQLIRDGGRVVGCEAQVFATVRSSGIEERPEPLAGEALGWVMEGLARGVDDVLGDALYLRRTDAEIFSQAKAAT